MRRFCQKYKNLGVTGFVSETKSVEKYHDFKKSALVTRNKPQFFTKRRYSITKVIHRKKNWVRRAFSQYIIARGRLIVFGCAWKVFRKIYLVCYRELNLYIDIKVPTRQCYISLHFFLNARAQCRTWH